MNSLNVQKKVHEWLIRIKDDPLIKILSKNSHLTKIQLETLLIDELGDDIAEKKMNYEEKSSLRISRSKISRGSFNRTLRQARKNVIRSIYTLLLLGYLGIMETPNFSSFLEISNRLESYMEAYRALWNESTVGFVEKDKLKPIIMMQEELKQTLEKLSRFKQLKKL